MYWKGKKVAIFHKEKYYGTSYTSPADLEANEMYRVVVTAYKSSGANVSDGKEILIPSDFYKNTPLSVPQNVVATADAASVTVKFDKVARAAGYDILFDNVINSVTGTTKVFGGLSPKTNHTYAVRAKNSTKTKDHQDASPDPCRSVGDPKGRYGKFGDHKLGKGKFSDQL